MSTEATETGPGRIKSLAEAEYLARVAACSREPLQRELAASVLVAEISALHAEVARLRGGIARVVGRTAVGVGNE
jgi:hypothetical protein